MEELLTQKQVLDYEVRTSWVSSFIWFDWGQDLMSKYLVRKAERKYKAYLKSKELEKELMNNPKKFFDL